MKEVQVAYARELIAYVEGIEVHLRDLNADGQPNYWPEECRLDHLKSLCRRLIENHESMSETKCGRWVGFVQGVLCTRCLSDVARERRAYKDCKKKVMEASNGNQPLS
jgi:hypothetical protein